MPDPPLASSPRKLVLVVVDSMRCDMLLRAVEAGDAPTFRKLIDRGELIGDCVSSFPSVTPVCTSEITTGERPDRHLIPGMNWYHRAEQRYVEYGSSFEATRAFGLFRSLYDTVYNLNMGHLNFETLTLFERLADAGYRTAGTPFLIYRGRTRHEVGLEGLLKAFANAARFHHAVWGPEQLFYGELYSSRKVDAKPTLARPATRDAYSAAAARILVAEDLYDFLLFSLPDNDYYSHRDGPYGTQESIALADDALAELVDAHGGIDPFLETNGVIVVADHAQSAVDQPLDLQADLGRRWQVLQPNAELSPDDQLAVGPSGRAAGVWILQPDADPESRRALAADVRAHLELEVEAVDLVAWLVGRSRSRPRPRRGERAPSSTPIPTGTCAIAAGSPGRSRGTRTRSAAGSATGSSSPTTTPTRSPASGRRSATPTPPTSSSASPPTGSAWTGAGPTTCRAEATARSSRRTRSARC